jgi:virginiamycin B lyase
MRARFATALLLLCVSGASLAVEIREWTVPYPDTRPRDPSVAPDGRVWFVGQTGNYLAVFDPSKEAFARFDLPEGTKPHTVVVDRDGHPWVAGNGNGTILRYGADGRLQQTYTVPERAGIAKRDPHTFAFDGRGGLWFTMQQGNAIGHLDTKTGAIRTVLVPTKEARPYGIVATPDGDAWAVLFGAGKLARVARADLALEEIALPRAASRPRRLGLDADGNVWYVDNAHGHLGRYDPKAKTADEWLSPSKPAAPYAMAVVDGVPWYFESGPQPNLLRRFDHASPTFADGVAIPGGGGTVRHMEYDPKRRSLWFGTDRNTRGQAVIATQ